MLATSKNVLFQGHNHLLTTGTDDPTLQLSPEHHLFVSRPCVRKTGHPAKDHEKLQGMPCKMLQSNGYAAGLRG